MSFLDKGPELADSHTSTTESAKFVVFDDMRAMGHTPSEIGSIIVSNSGSIRKFKPDPSTLAAYELGKSFASGVHVHEGEVYDLMPLITSEAFGIGEAAVLLQQAKQGEAA